MKKRFLIVSADQSCVSHPPVIAIADSDVAALQYFQRNITAKDSLFRESVLDLSCNMGFAERFYLATPFEQERLMRDHQVGTEPEIVKSRVKKYFTKRPDLGEKYLAYMETEDSAFMTEDVFQFIAENEEPDKHGLVALDLDAIPTITVS